MVFLWLVIIIMHIAHIIEGKYHFLSLVFIQSRRTEIEGPKWNAQKSVLFDTYYYFPFIYINKERTKICIIIWYILFFSFLKRRDIILSFQRHSLDSWGVCCTENDTTKSNKNWYIGTSTKTTTIELKNWPFWWLQCQFLKKTRTILKLSFL